MVRTTKKEPERSMFNVFIMDEQDLLINELVIQRYSDHIGWTNYLMPLEIEQQYAKCASLFSI